MKIETHISRIPGVLAYDPSEVVASSGEPFDIFSKPFGVQTTNPAQDRYFPSSHGKSSVTILSNAASAHPTTLATEQVLRSIAKLEARLSAIEQKQSEIYRLLSKLSDAFSDFASSRHYTTTLHSVNDASFEVFRDIPVLIESSGDEFTATFVEANVSASGETEADALGSLRDSLGATFDVLEDLPEESLGPLPVRQKAILRTVMRRVT